MSRNRNGNRNRNRSSSRCRRSISYVAVAIAILIGIQTLLVPFLMYFFLLPNAADTLDGTISLRNAGATQIISTRSSSSTDTSSTSTRWRPSDYAVTATSAAAVAAAQATTSGSHRHHDSQATSHQYDSALLQLRQMQRSGISVNEATKQSKSTASSSTSSLSNSSNSSTKQSDGTFNGYPIYFVDNTNATTTTNQLNGTAQQRHSSRVHCVGDNFQPDTAWMHKSCHFQHFCFDTRENEFVIFRSKQDVQVQEALFKYHDHPASTISSSIVGWFSSLFSNDASSTNEEAAVAIGGINPKWSWDKPSGVSRVKWFPKVIVTDEFPESYYELDPNVVWVPFHSFYAANPGHLVWDDFLPIYTLLRMFSLLDGYQPLLMRYVLPGEPLWATCDMDEKKELACNQMFQKFLPLFGLSFDKFSTNRRYHFATARKQKSTLICSKQGAAGLGMLTDHGTKLHGVRQDDYATMHNHGRSALLLDFRHFMMSNLQISTRPSIRTGPPYTVTFAVGSSQKKGRHFSFSQQRAAVVDAFGKLVDVQTVYIAEETLEDQVRIASESAIYVTACGGGAVTATFLPPDASLILFYTEDKDVAARLDWDILNNMAWIRCHWLPAKTMNDDIGLFVQLVARELDLIPRTFQDQ